MADTTGGLRGIFPRGDERRINLANALVANRSTKAPDRRTLTGQLETIGAVDVRIAELYAEAARLGKKKDRALKALEKTSKRAMDGLPLESAIVIRAEHYIQQSSHPPEPPREVRVEVQGNLLVRVSWRRPRKSLGGRARSYQIECAREPSGSWGNVVITYKSPTEMKLPAVGVWYLRIVSHNEAGKSSPTDPITVYVL